jgi:archaemetzincin
MMGSPRGLVLALALPALAVSAACTKQSAPPPQPQAQAQAQAQAQPPAAPPISKLERQIERLRALHSKLPPPGPSDWLAHHKEAGQTFAEYMACDPTLPRGARRTLYVLPLGDFTAAQQRIVDLSAEFLRRYFNLPATILDGIPLSEIPPRARRTHPSWGDSQILSTYVLDRVLRPRLPDDAAAMIALTAADLWPGDGWNFVFGQASLRHRVGVWSIYRNGDAEKEFALCLLRTIKTATHETGHMFSIDHCTAYRCNMCGSNSRAESDRNPLWLCPECVAKVAWATGDELVPRYRRLAEFCDEHGLRPQAEFYRRSIAVLEAE